MASRAEQLYDERARIQELLEERVQVADREALAGMVLGLGMRMAADMKLNDLRAWREILENRVHGTRDHTQSVRPD